MDFSEKLDTHAKPSKRLVGNNSFNINASIDDTSHFRTFLEGLIQQSGENGYPSRLQFYITSNNNTKLTEDNKILAKTLPIFPPLFNPNPDSPSWSKNSDTFVRYATSQASIQKSYHSLDPDAREGYVNESSDLLMAYLLTEIGTRYSLAKKYGDTKTMKQLKSLSLIKEEGVSLEMFDLVLKTPNGLTQDSGRLFFTTQGEKGTIRNYLNEQQTDSYYKHKQLKNKGEIGAEYTFHTLYNIIDEYEMYDIKRAEFNQGFGGHIVGKYTQHSDKPKPSAKPIKAIDLSQEIKQDELGQ